MTEPAYRLGISASSPALQHRVERAARHLMARVPDDVAAFLARSAIVYAVDVSQHAAFVTGHLARRDTPLALLVDERARQAGTPATPGPLTEDALFTIVIAARSLGLLDTLAHECAHVWRRDPLAAASQTPEEEDATERETDRLAQQWLASPPREDEA